MAQEEKTVCPHCGQQMSKWCSPAVDSWGSEFQYICFNDDCGYYRRGWEHTFKTIGLNASYRHRFDPNTGQMGPFPVSSPKAGKEGIIQDD